MSGRVLDSSAIVDIACARSVFGRAFLVAAVELGMVLRTPAAALLRAWCEVPPENRVLLELFLDTPTVVIENLDAPASSRAGIRAHPAHLVAGVDLAAAHTVDVALDRGLPVLTAEPTPLRAIAATLEIEELPAL